VVPRTRTHGEVTTGGGGRSLIRPARGGRKVATTLTRDRISAVVDSQDEQVGHVVEVSGDVAYVDPVTDPAVSMAVNQNRIRGKTTKTAASRSSTMRSNRSRRTTSG